MTNLLYRGVSASLHEKLCGILKPKESATFAREPSWDQASWDDSTWGESEHNGVVEHQLEQAGFPTSGISTTPNLQRAIFYATNGGALPDGYVYVIDRDRLAENHISTYVVNDLLVAPSVPEDDEVILVANDFGALPASVIVEVRRVAT